MQEALHSKRVKAGSKDYFFDVKKTKNGDGYLQITESRKNQAGERMRNTIMIFKNHLPEFSSSLQEMDQLM